MVTDLEVIEKEVQGSITGCSALWVIRKTEETGDLIVLVLAIAIVSALGTISAGLPVSIRKEFYLRLVEDLVPDSTKAATDSGQVRVAKVVQRCTSVHRLDHVPGIPIQRVREFNDLFRSRSLG